MIWLRESLLRSLHVASAIWRICWCRPCEPNRMQPTCSHMLCNFSTGLLDCLLVDGYIFANFQTRTLIKNGIPEEILAVLQQYFQLSGIQIWDVEGREATESLYPLPLIHIEYNSFGPECFWNFVHKVHLQWTCFVTLNIWNSGSVVQWCKHCVNC